MKIGEDALIKMLLVAMLICNAYAFVYIAVTGSIETSYPGNHLNGFEIALGSFLSVTAFYVAIYFFFMFGRRLPNKRRAIAYSESGVKYLSKFVILIQLFYIFAIYTEGAGSAGGVVNDSQTIISSLFTLFRVDDFALIFMLCYISAPYFRLNISLYFISFILRGWLGVLISFLLVVVVRKTKKSNDIKLAAPLIFVLAMASLFPFLMAIRNDMRLSNDFLFEFRADSYSALLGYGVIDGLIDGMHGLLMRFQQMESIIYFYQNINSFEIMYDQKLITPVYFDGPFISGLFKYYYNTNSNPLGLVLAEHSRELIFGRKSAVSPGLLTYFLLDFFTIFYIVLIPIVYGYFATFFPRSSHISIGCFYLMILYFSFGWSNAVLGSLVAISIFVALSIMLILIRDRPRFGTKILVSP